MTNIVTFSQIKHLIETFETLGSGQLQALYDTGLLDALRRGAAESDLAKIDRDKYRRMLGIGPSSFTVKMGGRETADQIRATLGFALDGWITQANFPLGPSETPWEDEVEFIDPGSSFGREDALILLGEAGLDRPTYEHALRFAEQHGKTTISEKKPYVVFLHEAWKDPFGDNRVMVLDRGAGHSKLGLGYPDDGFRGGYVVAGIRRRKQLSST